MLNVLNAQTITLEGSEVWKAALEIYDENADLGEISSVVLCMDQFYTA